LKNDVNVPVLVPSKRNKHKNVEKTFFFVGALKVTDEKSRIKDTDPLDKGTDPRIRICYKNVTDPEHSTNITYETN
jgi:hypothetical protein